MKLKIFKILILTSLVVNIISAQILTHKTEFDLGNDHKSKKLLFYDKFHGEFERTEFTNLLVISGTDTVSVENDEVWVVNPELINFADETIDNRVGIIKHNKKYYLLLTGFQYGCCRNKTTIFEWTGTSLVKYFDQEFEVKEILNIDTERYLVGNYTFSEGYGNEGSDLHFYSFYPTEYRSFSDNFKVNRELTQEKNLNYPVLEKYIDVYNSTLVKENITNQTFMISKQYEKTLKEREFGVISLVNLPDEYFQNFDKTRLRIMRNELFAYYGYNFNSEDLKKYFSNKPWYKPTDMSSEEIAKQLSDIEKHNIQKIKEKEKKSW